MTDYYFHTPGKPGLGGVLDVGLKCTHSCKFCYYSFWDSSDHQFQALRKGEFRPFSDCLDILSKMAEHGLKHVDVTGGEPTLHPQIVDITRHARKLGLGFRIITLGQFLMQKASDKPQLLNQLLEAGISDFLFSIHAADKTAFKEFTGGDLDKLFAAMNYLHETEFQFGTNTVVFQDNLSQLPEIAKVVASKGAYTHNFILFNAYHRWTNVPEITRMQAKFKDIEAPLKQAVEILSREGICVNIRFAPLCVFPGLERHIVGVVGIPYDPFEWRNRACNYDKPPDYCAEPIAIDEDGTLFDYRLIKENLTLKNGTKIIAKRGNKIKIFPETCKQCAAMPICDGLDPRYLLLHGTSELKPYKKFDKKGALASARIEYKAPFFVKMKTKADMKKAINLSFAAKT